MDLIKRLNRLGKRMNTQHPRINWGGCCVFAARVAEHLSAIVPTRIRVAQGWEGREGLDIDTARAMVKTNAHHEWNAAGLYFAHVIVEFELDGRLYHYDSDGVKPAERINGHRPIVNGHLTNEEARDLAADAKGWNRMFKREQIPAVHRLIDDAFDRMAKASSVVSKGKKR